MSRIEAFGNLLVRLRLEAGLTKQKELADLIDCTQQSVSRWELGASKPRKRELEKLVQVLKVHDPTALYQAWSVAPFPGMPDDFSPLEAWMVDPDALPAPVLSRMWRYHVTRYGDDGQLELNERGEFVAKPVKTRQVRTLTNEIFRQASAALGRETQMGWPILTANFGVRIPCIVWASAVPESIESVRVLAPSAPELCMDIVDAAYPTSLRERRIAAFLSTGAHEVVNVCSTGEIEYWGAEGRRKHSAFKLKLVSAPLRA